MISKSQRKYHSGRGMVGGIGGVGQFAERHLDQGGHQKQDHEGHEDSHRIAEDLPG
jgi:hypothetical protein